jgi:hypothetical protein
MSVINKFTSELAHFMAKSFMPSTVTIKFNGNINNVKYVNSLFQFSLQSNDKKKEVYCKFIDYSNSYFYYTKNNFIKTPEQFLKGLIDFNMTNSIYTKYKYNNNQNIIEFKSNSIPYRYLLMLKDFCPDILVQVDPVSKTEFDEFENKIKNKIDSFELSDKFCTKLLQEIKFYANYSQFKTIEILKAPQYSNVEYEANKKKYNINYAQPDKKYLYEQFKSQVWKSGDGLNSSPSTQIFISKSHNYDSLCNPIINKEKYGYQFLHSSSGGIDFGYMKNLPLYQLLGSFSMSSLYHDLKGLNTYSNSSEIDLIELTIFEEILKKEGAEIEVE